MKNGQSVDEIFLEKNQMAFKYMKIWSTALTMREIYIKIFQKEQCKLDYFFGGHLIVSNKIRHSCTLWPSNSLLWIYPKNKLIDIQNGKEKS